MHYFCSVVLYCAEFDSIILYSIFLLRCFVVCYIDLNCIIAMSLLVLQLLLVLHLYWCLSQGIPFKLFLNFI